MQKLKVGMIGCGMVSSVYLQAFSALSQQLELVGVLASSTDSAHQFICKAQSEYPDIWSSAPQPCQNADALMALNPDFVIITTPPNAREAFIDACIAHHVPVLMEKPVERSSAAATRLVERCEQAGLPLAVMFQHRVRPSAQMLQQHLARAEAGRLYAVEISVPWWREQSYYDVQGRGSYARDGGGVMISQAIHTLDLVLQFTSDIDTVTAVRAQTGFHQLEAEDFVSASIGFSCGAIGHMMASTACYPGRSEEFWLHFEHCSYKVQSAQIEIFTRASHPDGQGHEICGDIAATGAGADPMGFTSDWHQLVIENFITHLADASPLIATGRSALHVHHFIDKIEKASQLIPAPRDHA